MNSKDALIGNNLRLTPARIRILEYLSSVQKPVDAGSVLEYLVSKSLATDEATIYRVLNLFYEKGIISRLQLNDKKFYYEAAGQEHHHVICNNCGAVEDVSGCSIPQLEKEIEKKTKFKVLSHSLEFFGLCKNCSK